MAQYKYTLSRWFVEIPASRGRSTRPFVVILLDRARGSRPLNIILALPIVIGRIAESSWDVERHAASQSGRRAGLPRG